MTKEILGLRIFKRDLKNGTKQTVRHHVRAELQRVARQVRKIRKEVNAPTCEVDAGYKTALNDVLALLKEAQR